MLKFIDVEEGVRLSDYEYYVTLTMAVNKLKTEANTIVPKLKDRKVWMISSTDKGGGVAEMMPRKISLLRQLGVDIDWVVMTPDNKDFFKLTKRIHNMIHGQEGSDLTEEERVLYEQINQEAAHELIQYIDENDVVVIHDPQPLGMAKYIKQKLPVKIIWRCHIGYEKELASTRKAWGFLEPFLSYCDHGIFTAAEYIPNFMAGKSSLIYPSIDPLSHKNRDLSVNKLVGILCNAKLVQEHHPILTPHFSEPVQRVKPDGSLGSAIHPNDIGLLFSPLVTQISRWDRLKGFRELIEGFTRLKKGLDEYGKSSKRHHRRLQLVKLVLAGPEPSSIQDDPEGQEVIHELIDFYKTMSSDLQDDIALLMLPMKSLKHNALIVNALQRSSSVVAQNSIREGFGLTATEAMWKNAPVMIGNACGLRQQVRDEIDGKIVKEPTDPNDVAKTLNEMLKMPKKREVWGYTAQKRVLEEFLIFSHLGDWLAVFDSVLQKQTAS